MMASSTTSLEPSRGGLERIFRGCSAADGPWPIFEVMDYRALGKDDATMRFVVTVSDGEYTGKVMTSQPLMNLFKEKQVPVHSLVRITSWNVSSVPTKKPGAPPTQVAVASIGEVVGMLPPERQSRAQNLRKFEAAGASVLATQMSQVAPGLSQLIPSPYTTPEKRPDGSGLVDRTPSPMVPPPATNRGVITKADEHANQAFMGSSTLAPPRAADWGAMGVDPDAPTQDTGLFEELPVHNPYSTNAALEAGVSSSQAPVGQAYGFAAMSSAPPQGSSAPNHSGLAAMSTAPQGLPAPSPLSTTLNNQAPPQEVRSAVAAAPWRATSLGQNLASAAPEGRFQNPLQHFGFGPRPGAAEQAHLPTTSTSSSLGGQQGSFGQPMSRAAVSPAGGACMPIVGLTPYTNGRWRIKARVTVKSDIRKFNNQKGEGQLFKVDLVDKDGGEISATFFGKAVDRHFSRILQHQVYYFSRGSVKMGNKRFDKTDHVITFDENSVIEPAEPDDEIPGVNYVFVTVADIIDRLAVGTTVDIKAIICEVRDPFTVTLRKNNEERVKRDLVLWDDSGPDGSSFIELCVWGQPAHDNFEVGTVIYAKDYRIGEWQGSKSLNGGATYELNPDSPQAFALRRKFEEKQPNYVPGTQARGTKMMSPGTRLETIEDCINADMDLAPPAAQGEEKDPRSTKRHTIMATLTTIQNDRAPYYPACPEYVERSLATQQAANGPPPPKRQCNKKVTLEGDVWKCQAGHTCQRPNYRYFFTKQEMLDHTGSLDLQLFDEGARQVMGCEAEELAALWENPTRDIELNQRLAKPAWKRYVFRLKSSKESFREELKTKVIVEEAMKLDFVKEGSRMLDEIKAALQ